MDNQQAGHNVHWHYPGEIVVAAHVRNGNSREEMHARLHGALRQHMGQYVATDPASLKSVSFQAPGESRSLVFFFQRLAKADSIRAVKDAVEALHGQLSSLSSDTISIIGAMPHLHMRAHEPYGGGSPGSYPRPVYPDQVPGGFEYRFYEPVNPKLNRGQQADDRPVRVAVLDTRFNAEQARSKAAYFRDRANNHQLLKTLDALATDSGDDARLQDQFKQLAAHYGTAQVGPSVSGEPPLYLMPDHGLFVSGLIHAIAPNAPLSFEPALNDMGVGDLSLLLLGLQRVLARKQPSDPQIINLSLGFLPHPARLPAAWYGLQRPHDPDYVHVAEMFDPDRDEHWVAANRGEVERTVDFMEAGLRELGRYLSLNNCLVVAAAGNDSLRRVEAHQGRLEPRLPARFETVLGVAATQRDPHLPADYSNIGDERELGDHVATFGGNVTNGLQPEDGVIGIYSGEFPFNRPNETGWASWSGTSFATAIVSGIAANYWAYRRKEDPGIHASTILADLHKEASAFGPYVPALRTPAIEVHGRWGRR